MTNFAKDVIAELKKLILDTSICIDLYHGKLLKAVLQLSYKFILPDVIIEELNEPSGELLLELGFSKEGTTGEETKDIFTLRNAYAGPSTNDLFALLLAKRMAVQLSQATMPCAMLQSKKVLQHTAYCG